MDLRDKYKALEDRIIVFFPDEEEQISDTGIITPGYSARPHEQSDTLVEKKLDEAYAVVTDVGPDCKSKLLVGDHIKVDGTVTKLEVIYPSDEFELGPGVFCSIKPYNIAARINK